MQARAQLLDRWRFEHRPDRNLNVELRANSAHQPGCKQRMPTEIEEVVGDAYSGRGEHLFEQSAEYLFVRSAWSAIGVGGYVLGRRQRAPVDLAIRVQRPRRQHDHRGRRKVVGQTSAQRVPEPDSERRCAETLGTLVHIPLIRRERQHRLGCGSLGNAFRPKYDVVDASRSGPSPVERYVQVASECPNGIRVLAHRLGASSPQNVDSPGSVFARRDRSRRGYGGRHSAIAHASQANGARRRRQRRSNRLAPRAGRIPRHPAVRRSCLFLHSNPKRHVISKPAQFVVVGSRFRRDRDTPNSAPSAANSFKQRRINYEFLFLLTGLPHANAQLTHRRRVIRGR